MPYRPGRRRPTFWEELGDYLLGELRALGKMFLALFLVSSLLVGMYQILRSLVLFLLFN